MKSHLAQYFSMVRRNQGISLAQLARYCGYRNVSKGSRRIDQFEKFGQIHEDLLVKLAAALGINQETIARLVEEDRREYLAEWEQWVNTPIKPSVILGHIGGFSWSEPLPENVAREAAEEYAATVAKEKGRPICLVLSRRVSIWFDAEGNRTSVQEAKPGDINVPYLRFGRRKATFDLGTGKAQILNEPQKPGPEEVVSDFGGIRMRSSFEAVEEEPGQMTINIEGPIFEVDDENMPHK